MKFFRFYPFLLFPHLLTDTVHFQCCIFQCALCQNRTPPVLVFFWVSLTPFQCQFANDSVLDFNFTSCTSSLFSTSHMFFLVFNLFFLQSCCWYVFKFDYVARPVFCGDHEVTAPNNIPRNVLTCANLCDCCFVFFFVELQQIISR